jgi:Na+-transporting NADH:ubiquinone oxidoreductase subunit NqrD
VSLPGTRTIWEEGHEPGREMVALGVALALTAAAVDLMVTDRVGVLFDLGFVALCAGLALAVRRADFFAVGVLPPLLMLSTFLLLAMSRAEAIARAHDSAVQAVVSGLAHHSLALGVGYALALVVLAVRHRVARLREAALDPQVTRTGPDHPLPV